MREVTLRWDLFSAAVDRGLSEFVINHLLSLQTVLNVAWLQKHPDAPRLYESGLRYAVEGPYAEVWQTFPVAYRGDVADCEDLACMRAAELIVSGEDPGARAVFYGRQLTPRRRLYHVIVRRTTGPHEFEDPSRALGMASGRRKGL